MFSYRDIELKKQVDQIKEKFKRLVQENFDEDQEIFTVEIFANITSLEIPLLEDSTSEKSFDWDSTPIFDKEPNYDEEPITFFMNEGDHMSTQFEHFHFQEGPITENVGVLMETVLEENFDLQNITPCVDEVVRDQDLGINFQLIHNSYKDPIYLPSSQKGVTFFDKRAFEDCSSIIHVKNKFKTYKCRVVQRNGFMGLHHQLLEDLNSRTSFSNQGSSTRECFTRTIIMYLSFILFILFSYVVIYLN